MSKLVNMLVIAVWVFAQTLTAANSGTHIPSNAGSTSHGAHSAMTGHSMHADLSSEVDGHAGNHATPCPVSGAKKVPSGSSDRNCCDQANCHVADLMLANADTGGRHIEVFDVDAQRSHIVWAPASPLPPPNRRL